MFQISGIVFIREEFCFERKNSTMVIKDILQVMIIIFIFAMPISLIVLIFTDFREFKKKVQDIHKKKRKY